MLKLLIILLTIFIPLGPAEPEDLSLAEPEELTLGTEPIPEDISALPESEVSVELIIMEPDEFFAEMLVYLDEKRLGITPFIDNHFPVGQHYLSFRKKDYFPYEKDIYFLEGSYLNMLLPGFPAPEGYEPLKKEAEKKARAIFDMELGQFRIWLRSEARDPELLVGIADSCAELGEEYENVGLLYDALRARNSATGFYLLLELAAGTDFFSVEKETSASIADEALHLAEINEAEQYRLIEHFIDQLSSTDLNERAFAAHSLRHSYSSFDGSLLVLERLYEVLEEGQIRFVTICILEAIDQIEFDPTIYQHEMIRPKTKLDTGFEQFFQPNRPYNLP